MQIPGIIPTWYKHQKFRSRLEARWAVFLDALGIEWVYEAEGYVIENNQPYLPDFWLPTFHYNGCFLEVKPKDFTEGELLKCKLLCKLTGYSVWLGVGVPDIRAYEIVSKQIDYEDTPTERIIVGARDGKYDNIGIPNADQAQGENRFYLAPGYENEDLSIPEEWRETVGEHYISAVIKSRNYPFQKRLGGEQID